MKNNRFEQFENWYRSEAAYNLDAEELSNLVDEKDRESVFEKLGRFFVR